jgi:hypothetical protein
LKELQQLQQLSTRFFPELSSDAFHTKEEFIKYLTPKLTHLLDHDFEHLMQIMYRIDVPEREFALTLEFEKGTNIAENLAELIYDRLMLKVKMRKRYSS